MGNGEYLRGALSFRIYLPFGIGPCRPPLGIVSRDCKQEGAKGDQQIGENNDMDQKVSKALLTALDDLRATDGEGVRGSGDEGKEV